MDVWESTSVLHRALIEDQVPRWHLLAATRALLRYCPFGKVLRRIIVSNNSVPEPTEGLQAIEFTTHPLLIADEYLGAGTVAHRL